LRSLPANHCTSCDARSPTPIHLQLCLSRFPKNLTRDERKFQQFSGRNRITSTTTGILLNECYPCRVPTSNRTSPTRNVVGFLLPTPLHEGRREQPSQLKLRISLSPCRIGLRPENKLHGLGAKLPHGNKGNDSPSAKDISSLGNACISIEAGRDTKLACATSRAVP
jgi:hypothetical protein